MPSRQFVTRFVPLALLLWFQISCSRQPANLVQLQQQRADDYLITLFNDSGVVKQHSNTLVLEIRNGATSQPTDVNNLQIQATMRMPGMGPMFGTISSTRKSGPGRYDFDADFSMGGQWNFVVTFDPMVKVQFNLNAQ